MAISPVITSADEITLVTLQNCPLDLGFAAKVFRRIGELGVDVDMIALAPSQGGATSISFTLADNDLDKLLSFTSELQSRFQVKAIVSSGNCKISVYDRNMKNTPGIAAQVFSAVAAGSAEVRIITTSEVDISLLVTAADFPEAYAALNKEFNN